MSSSFLEQYVEEARENLEELQNGLLRLENEEGDEVAHTVKELFRFAHNLKGMSGAMALDGITETAHKMEDLLDRYRQSGGRPTSDEVDVLLSATDALTQMVDEAAGGANPEASRDLIALLVAHTNAGEAADDRTAAAVAPKQTDSTVDLPPGQWLEVTLKEGAQLPGARCAIVLRALAEKGQIVDVRPSREAVEAGKARVFHVSMGGVADLSEVATLVAGLTDMESASVVDVAASSGASAGGGGTRLEVTLNEDAQLPGARAAIVLRLCAERGTVGVTSPDKQTIEAGKARSFVVEVRDVEDLDALVADISSVTDVASVNKVAAPAGGGGGGGGGGGSAATRATVRVEVERLDDLMDLVSELVVGRGLLDEQASRLGDRAMQEALATVHRTISDLQAMVAKVRMISLEKTFARLTRIVRDTARDVNKPVRFVTSGEDTELDRSMVDEVADPLMHLLRNSVDHGIEDADARKASGKDPMGEVALRAYSEGNQVVIEVSDDGGGIDVEKVVAKAIRNGVITEEQAKAMSRDEQLDLVFAPGLSTRETASKISGRGVGMDVVRSAATKLGGSVMIESAPGKGSVFTIRLPLSLAVAEALLVRVCDETWAIPIDQIEETMSISADEVRSVRGMPVIDLRGEVVPVVHGRERMFDAALESTSHSAVVVKHKGRRTALTVDTLIGRSEVVVKPLPPDLSDVELASAVTILGDGTVGLILNVSAVNDAKSRLNKSAVG